MKQLSTYITLAVVTILVSGCSWGVNLVIGNNSNEDIFIEYLKPTESDGQFFAMPKTYHFDQKLASLYRNKTKFNELPTQYFNDSDTSRIHIILEPGQALHIGTYYSFQNREELTSKYKLSLKIGSAATDGFQHWKNIHTDIMEVY